MFVNNVLASGEPSNELRRLRGEQHRRVPRLSWVYNSTQGNCFKGMP